MGDLNKSYTNVQSGITNLDPQALHAEMSVPVDARQQHPIPSGVQPGETIADSDGAMVRESPSESGTGAMHPGAGNRDG